MEVKKKEMDWALLGILVIFMMIGYVFGYQIGVESKKPELMELEGELKKAQYNSHAFKGAWAECLYQHEFDRYEQLFYKKEEGE